MFSLVAIQGATAAPALGAAQGSTAPAAASTVNQIEDKTARTFASSLADPAWRTKVRTAALAQNQVDLRALTSTARTKAAKQLRPSLARADQSIANAKGLSAATGSLLQLRLGDDSMREDLKAGVEPLVAAAPSDDKATKVNAYDSRGRVYTLDTLQVPNRPVYVLDTDAEKALTAGLAVLRAEFAKYGLSTPSTQDSSFWSTRIKSISLSDDKEPWIKGSAEIYSLVAGFGKNGEVQVDPVDMPYLDKNKHMYYPNQVLVNWSYYKYNLADVVMMEEDDGTNYRDLAKAIATVLLTVADAGAFTPLANLILDAIPDSWWTDGSDYVDSWYSLAKDAQGARNGALGNGTMTLEPYYVQDL